MQDCPADVTYTSCLFQKIYIVLICVSFVYAMGDESYDGYGHVKQLNADTTKEELIQLYSAWSKTYDKVNFWTVIV